MSTGKAVLIMPTAKPCMMVVAAPVWVALAIARVGFSVYEVKCSVA